jgi:hypothetical protein
MGTKCSGSQILKRVYNFSTYETQLLQQRTTAEDETISTALDKER